MNLNTHRRQLLRLLPGLLMPGLVAAQTKDSRMWMIIGERRFSITLADTEAAREFAAMLPLSIDMADFNGNEKHAELPRSLPTSSIAPARSAMAISCCTDRARWLSFI